MIVNGKEYPLWSQFVEQKEKWIGGTLQDFGDSMDRAIFGNESPTTKITDITLEPSGDDAAFFSVVGEDFTCGFSTCCGGIVGTGQEEDWLAFSGYMGHSWRIKAHD